MNATQLTLPQARIQERIGKEKRVRVLALLVDPCPKRAKGGNPWWALEDLNL